MLCKFYRDGKAIGELELDRNPWRDEVVAVVAQVLGVTGDDLLAEVVRARADVVLTMVDPEGGRWSLTVGARLVGGAVLEVAAQGGLPWNP